MSRQKMVEIPWRDGTTREVPEGTVCRNGERTVYAYEGGYRSSPTHFTYPWNHMCVSHIYLEAPEPSEVIKVPTGIGAVVMGPAGSLLIHHTHGWVGSNGNSTVGYVKALLRDGGRVLSEGIDPGKLTEKGD